MKVIQGLLIYFFITFNVLSSDGVTDYLRKNKVAEDEVYQLLAKFEDKGKSFFLYYGEYMFDSESKKPGEGEFVLLSKDKKGRIKALARDQQIDFDNKKFTFSSRLKMYKAYLNLSRKINPNFPAFFSHLKLKCSSGKCSKLEKESLKGL